VTDLPGGPRLSPWVTAACAVLLVAFLGVFGWLLRATSPLDAVDQPEEALLLIVNRALDARDGLERLPGWERRLYQALVTDGGREIDESVEWLEELAGTSLDPRVDVALAILRGESGALDALAETLAEWERRPGAFPDLAALLTLAYLDGAPAPDEAPALLAQVGDEMPEGWLLDRVTARVAARTGDQALLAEATARLEARAAALAHRVRALAAALLGILVWGLAAAALLARRRRLLRVGDAPLPPPWPAGRGLGVLARGAVLGIVVSLGLSVLVDLPLDAATLDLVLVVATEVPLLCLAAWYLLRPAGLGFGAALGLSPVRGGAPRLLLVVPARVALGALGDLALGMLGDRLQWAAHWAEWFQADLAWGAPATVAASVAASVVAAPLFEEITFRGLLFATLRGRLGVVPAALASALVFAVAHGYGAAGFASVLWSGVLWAVGYELTRSLWPGILAHAASNLVTAVGLLALLR
jgi:membrane protease YdiL (CAAX protease family)